MSLKKLFRTKLLLIVLALLFGTSVFTEFAKAQTYVSQITFPYNPTSTPTYYMTAQSWALQTGNGSQTIFSRNNNTTWGQTGLGDIINTYNLEAGQQYRIAVRGMNYYSSGYWYFGYYRMTSRQWIDWNADGDFADAGERMLTNYYNAGASTNPLGTSPYVWHYFTVPAGTEGRTFRMRIAIAYSTTYPPINGTGYVSTYGDAWDLQLHVKPKSDAGISAIVEPPARFMTGTQDLTFKLRNYGATLTQVNINYTIDGGAPMTYLWTGNMVKDSTADITVGTYNFNQEKNYTIVAYTSLPNNEADNNTSNDQASVVIVPAPDAGITSFTQPSGAFPMGNQVIAVNLHNFGVSELTSARIVWRSGIGGQVYTYDWTGNLAPNGTEEVVVGNYNFDTYQLYNLDAYTEVPDGVTDKDETNDRATYDCGPALAPSNYYIGSYSGASNTFESASYAANYISLAGIIGDGTLYIIYPDMELGDPNYQETNPIVINNYPSSGNNNIVIKSESGNPEKVKVEYSPDYDNPYMVSFTNSDKVSIEGIEFIVHGNNGYGGIINIDNCNDVTLKDNIFTGVGGASMNNNFTTVNLNSSYGVHVMNNTFRDGAIGINEQSMCPRSINIHNNIFTDLTWKFVQLNGISDGNPCDENNVIVRNNEFLGSAYNARFGIISTNGTEIYENIFSGLTGTNGTDAVILLNNTDPTNFNGTTTIDNNEIYSNLTEINGISASNIPNLEITNNTISVNENAGSWFATNAILLNSCGTNSPVYITDNNIAYSNSEDGNALNMTNCDVMILRNDIDLSTPQTSFGYGIIATQTTGYIANNQIAPLLGTGVNLNNSTLSFYYNTVANQSANSPAITVIGGSNTIMRNIFQNEGVGFAIVANSASGCIFNQNNYYSYGTNVGQWNNDNQDSLLLWQTVSGQDLNSTEIPISFIDFAAFNLGLNTFTEDLVFDDPLSISDPTIEAMVQGKDYNGKTRYSYFMGSENIVPEIFITHQPADVMDCVGEKDHSLRVSAYVTRGVLARYEWFKDDVSLTTHYTDPTDDWASKASLYLDSISFNPEPGLHYEIEGTYRCFVRGSGAEPQWSNYVLVNVLSPPEITEQPESQRANLGGEVIFEVHAHIVADSGKGDDAFYQPEIQWYRGSINNPIEDDFSPEGHYYGAKTNILAVRNITASEIGDDYFVVFRGACDSLYSESASIKLFPSVTINEDPATQAICEGKEVTFKVTASASDGDATVKYQWRKTKDGQTMAINGATESSYMISAVTADDVAEYDCMVTVFPGGSEKFSDKASLTMKLGPTITLQPTNVPTGTVGQPFSLLINAEGDEPLSFQWYKDDVMIDGATSHTFSVLEATSDDGGDYYCEVKNECNTVKSNTVTVTIGTGGALSVGDAENGGYILNNAMPNPVSNESTIRFFAPKTSAVRLSITDVYGKELSVLFEGVASPNWNEVKVNASELASGVYYFTLTDGRYSITRKMVVAK